METPSLEKAKTYVKDLCSLKLHKYDICYRVEFSDRMKRVLGKHMKNRKSTIHILRFSNYWVNTFYEKNEEALKELVLHEVGHAITSHKYTGNHGHDSLWENEVRSIGGHPQRLNTSGNELRPYKYIYKCPNCGKLTYRYRKYSSKGVSCGVCCKKYNNGKYTDKYSLELIEEIK